MTNEQAKDLLDNLVGMVSDNQNHDYDTALKIGIKAIEKCEQSWHDGYKQGWSERGRLICGE